MNDKNYEKESPGLVNRLDLENEEEQSKDL